MVYKVLVPLLILLGICNAQLPNTEWGKGHLLVHLNKDMFKFPLEVYGVYVSYPRDTENNVQIDSFFIQNFTEPGSRSIKSRETISKDDLIRSRPELLKQIHLDLSPELIKAFKQNGVYSIERIVKNFSYKDTIPHNIKCFKGQAVIKKGNENLDLKIGFDKSVDVVKFAEDLKKLKSVKDASPEKPIVDFENPHDTCWYNPSGVNQKD